MSVKLVFLGRMEDIAGAAELMLDVEQAREFLAACELELSKVRPRVRLALNGTLVNDRSGLVLADGDELAFLPPVSGG